MMEGMKNDANPGDLKPRAIAALVAMRRGPLAKNEIKRAIRDANAAETADLMRSMKDIGLVAERDGYSMRGIWYLDHAGLGWLQSYGMDATVEARVWTAADRSAS